MPGLRHKGVVFRSRGMVPAADATRQITGPKSSQRGHRPLLGGERLSKALVVYVKAWSPASRAIMLLKYVTQTRN